jgi:ubiquitin-activating enzyme E1
MTHLASFFLPCFAFWFVIFELSLTTISYFVSLQFLVDEKLYSRQLYVMGHDAQRRMMASRAVMIGCSGLGVEIAKNCILAGLHSLVLVDPLPATSYDWGGNFYLPLDDTTTPRAVLCEPFLAELNPYVHVSVAKTVTALTMDQLTPVLEEGGVTCVVVTIPLPKNVLIALNNKCREIHASLIYSITCGVFGSVFCDFGPNFICYDKDGNPPATSQIESVVQDETAETAPDMTTLVIKVLEDHGRHGLETDEIVTFARLKGIPHLMQGETTTQYKVKVTGPYTFEVQVPALADGATGTTTLAEGGSGAMEAQQGYITQVKQPATMSFETYETKLATPGDIQLSDFAKFDRPFLLHAAFQGLEDYRVANGGEFPSPGDAAAAAAVVEATKSHMEDAASLTPEHERIILQLASGSKAILSPMCAALGGIVGQEVLKACSGKFCPIQGFFYLDADETLPDTLLSLEQVTPQNSRYDSQIAVFGKDMQEKLLQLNYFLIGAGAIGCEMLKNWALMGVGCGPTGHVHVTDMDRIEKSNLSRQFLFRTKDINEFKSTTAANAAKVMNPDFKVTAYQEKVASDTEDLFGDDFYDKLNGVCTALDNVEARLYVDQRCLFYRLPMLESGTLGTKGNTQIVVPHVTENYGATRDPPEKSIPVCTLKNFPNQIQHTLQWARDWFEGEFKQSAEDVNAYLSQPPQQYWDSLQPNTRTETLKKIQKTLVEDRPVTMEDCVVWARLNFETLFNSQIRQLLHNFPPDQLTSSGTKFWSGSKRCPISLTFDLAAKCEDAEMNNHLDFVVAAANLRASMYGITGRTDREYFEKVLKDVIVPDFTPSSGVKIAANDAEEEKNNSNDDAMDTGDSEAETIFQSLPKQSDLAGFQLNPVEFDKDIDEHMLFVTACSNCRAMNYSIPTEDTHRSRAIAGRIIPAIATTTALVTGLICLELYKIIGTPRKELKIDAYKNAFLNLAIPFITMGEPMPPKPTKCLFQGKEWNWTAWDSLDMVDETKGDMTLGQFMEHFEREFNLEISMLSHGVSILYSFFANKQKVAERKAMRLTEVITSITKKEFPPNQLFLTMEVIANDKDTDEEVDIPYVKLRFR